jgi:hypothetical protein
VDELGDAGLDCLIGRKLSFRVELKLTVAPVEGADDCVVSGQTVALSVKEVAEQEVQGGRLAGTVPERKRTGGPLTLSGFQKRAKGCLGQ